MGALWETICHACAFRLVEAGLLKQTLDENHL